MADNSGRITAFDKSHYDQLIKYLQTVDDGINTSEYALGPSAKLKLDTTLSSTFHPGADSWPLAKSFVTQAATFGNSVHTRYTAVEGDVRTFYKALKGAEDVFDDTNDLTTYDASRFEQNYPDVGGGSTTAP
jgi:hypothetical protein